VKILYFAWLRARVGIAEEEVAPPAQVRDVAGLLAWLQARGPRYAEALRDLSAANTRFATATRSRFFRR
jgi:sulfur-carrier protein